MQYKHRNRQTKIQPKLFLCINIIISFENGKEQTVDLVSKCAEKEKERSVVKELKIKTN